MAQKELTPKQILDSIRNQDSYFFDDYVYLLRYVRTNMRSLAELDIMGSTEIKVTEDGLSEKEMSIQEKRIALLTKFSEKIAYYRTTLQEWRNELDKDDVKRAEQEVETADKTGLSVEAMMSKLNKNGK